VVANAVRTYFRKQKRRLFFFAGPPPEDVKDEAPDGEAIASARETTDWLERAIQALPLSQREVLVLATLENVPLNDIASILGLPVNTVKTQLRRARLRLIASYDRRTRATS
jgi:RNA polymerase sigma-70 factor (ECF subfamily)